MSFSAVELNYLILRYLEECGLTHTAFLFARESLVDAAEVDGREVPNGALVNIVQKGLAFAEFEMKAGGSEGGTEKMDTADVPGMTLLEAVTDDSTRQRVRERLGTNEGAGTSGQTQRDRDRDARADRSANGAAAPTPAAQLPPQRRDRSAAPSAPSPSSRPTLPTSSSSSSIPGSGGPGHLPNGQYNKKHAAALNGLSRTNGGSDSASASNVWRSNCEIDRSKVRNMKMHNSEVFICAWNPKRDLIGTGSGDSTARIWDVTGSELPTTSIRELCDRSVVLKHTVRTEARDGNPEANNKDVTSIDWDCSGRHLVTGCYDGFARIWAESGQLLGTLGAHKGPIFALKWNEMGNYILSAGVDKTTIIWDINQKREMQTFMFHQSSALDVDWMGPEMFASCSTDMKIHVCKLGVDKPLKTFEGHTNEVNAIRYDRHSKLLASCSDDRTLKVWSLDRDRPIMDVNAHSKEIYTIRWAPEGRVIASASFDHTVRLWDVERATCLRTLERHNDPVYSVSFSPDSNYIASGSFDRCIYIWDNRTGDVVLSYTGDQMAGGIFEVNWNSNGQKLGASTSDGSVLVLDVRQLGVGRKPPFRDFRAAVAGLI